MAALSVRSSMLSTVTFWCRFRPQRILNFHKLFCGNSKIKMLKFQIRGNVCSHTMHTMCVCKKHNSSSNKTLNNSTISSDSIISWLPVFSWTAYSFFCYLPCSGVCGGTFSLCISTWGSLWGFKWLNMKQSWGQSMWSIQQKRQTD